MTKVFLTGTLIMVAGIARAAAPLLNVDFAALAARADLHYTEPASRSEEGMPVGNGRMGSLIWTSPSALKLQINRVDVFAEDSTTTSFPQADSDYASGCGYVDVNVADAGDDVFAGNTFHQTLSLYDGLMTAKGNKVTARVLAWPRGDVMAIEIDDQRSPPSAVGVDLRMLRYAMQRVTGRNYELMTNHAIMVQTADHSATSRLDIRDGRILLLQEFREKAFYDASAVAIRIVGRKSKARYLNDSTVQLNVPPAKGHFTILISSAASFNPKQDVGALALAQLQAAEAKGFDTLRNETANWWRDFWSKGFVSMHSKDGQADFVEQNYTYFLYLMAASSRGAYPPRFGGMLWRTTGDLSRWGSQYWWANTRAYYENLIPANRFELIEPMFSLYSAMASACATAAEQQWGSKGIWIPETTFFNGPEKLPHDIAAELQELMLVRKPFEQRSPGFQRFAETKNRHNSSWNFQADPKWQDGHYITPNKGRGIFGHTTHILGASAHIAQLFWDRYEFAADTAWLRDRAYPIIKGSAEFYRNFPNLKKGDDGKYHIHHVNNGESDWDSSDTRYELSAMHLIFPLAIRASEILGVDENLRPLWREINENLVALPEDAGRRGTSTVYGAFVSGGPGQIEPTGNEPELKRRFLGFNRLGRFIDARGIGGPQIFRNRLRLREGPGAMDAEHLGGLTSGIHATMLSSDPVTPGGEPMLKLFNAWPKDWEAAFSLCARGAFEVSAAIETGKVGAVELRSLAGNPCQLQSPWGQSAVTLHREGKQSQNITPDALGLLKFATSKGETILLVQAGEAPDQFRRAIPGKPK